MHFVYILKSKKNKQLYIGCTDNLEKRLQEHNNGLSQATKPYTPWQIVYYESPHLIIGVGASAQRGPQYKLEVGGTVGIKIERIIA